MRRVAFIAVAVILSSTALAEAQNRCSAQDGSRFLAPSTTVQRPPGFNNSAVITLRKTDHTPVPNGPTLPPAMNTWDATTLRELVRTAGANTAELLWTQGDRACWQLVAVIDLPPAPPTPAAAVAPRAGPADAEPACMGSASVIVSSGAAVVRPPGFTAAASATLRKSDHSAAAGAPMLPPSNSQWDPNTVQLMRTAAGSENAELLWSEMGQATCLQTLTLSEVAALDGKPQPGATQNAYAEGECDLAGRVWGRTITPPSDRDVTMLVFDKEGGVCYQSNSRPRQGDPIYVGIFTDQKLAWTRARISFEPCSLESASPNILVNDRLPTITTEVQAGAWDIYHKFPARQCFDSAVLINVQGPAGQTFSYALRQATRYRATLHLGTVFTESHETTFGLRPSGQSKRIFAQGPVDRGPEYVAALVFYSLPRYFSKAGFHGRDPVEDNGWKDRFGGVIGVGLQHPTKRFITGFSFEAAAGVNVLGVWDWAQDNVLRGVSEGDIFAGTIEEIPVQKAWRQKFVLGVSMDLVYAATALKR